MLKNDGLKYARVNFDGFSHGLLGAAQWSVSDIFDILELDEDATESKICLMTDLIDPLSSSDSFIEMLNEIDENWSISFDQITNGGYSLNTEMKHIIIDNVGLLPDALAQSVYFKQCIRHNILRAVRDVWHHENFQSDYDELAPESFMATYNEQRNWRPSHSISTPN